MNSENVSKLEVLETDCLVLIARAVSHHFIIFRMLPGRQEQLGTSSC